MNDFKHHYTKYFVVLSILQSFIFQYKHTQSLTSSSHYTIFFNVLFSITEIYIKKI